MRYRKLPVEIDAFQYMDNCFEAFDWASITNDGNGTFLVFDSIEGLYVKTLEGKIHVSPGDFIICGVHGEFYSCKPDIFAKTYELVNVMELS